MRYYLSLVFTLLFLTLQAQEVNYLTTYYPEINKAEKAIIEGNLKNAFDSYQTAFKAVPRGFMKDYFNAAVCATYLGDATNTYKYLLEVANKGISLDFIKNEVAFYGIQQDPNWRNFELKYLEQKRLFDSKINKVYLTKINKIVERDAWFRQKDAVTFADTIAKVDKQNALELDYLIEKYGFPSEDIIGCGEGGMPVIQYPFYHVIRRQTGENQTVNFSNQLLKAMRAGKVSPHIVTHLMASINGIDSFYSRNLYKIVTDDVPQFRNLPFSGLLNKWVYRQISASDEQSINQIRLQNGLEPLADYRKKILFSLTDNRFLFPYKIFGGLWYVTDPNIAADYLEGAVLAE